MTHLLLLLAIVTLRFILLLLHTVALRYDAVALVENSLPLLFLIFLISKA